ncbi:hypothetical protein GCM10010388_42890 [Streptomyces mauvecolor]
MAADHQYDGQQLRIVVVGVPAFIGSLLVVGAEGRGSELGHVGYLGDWRSWAGAADAEPPQSTPIVDPPVGHLCDSSVWPPFFSQGAATFTPGAAEPWAL